MSGPDAGAAGQSFGDGAAWYRKDRIRGGESAATPTRLPLALATAAEDADTVGSRLSRPAVRTALRDQALLLIDEATVSDEDFDAAFVGYGDGEGLPAEDDMDVLLL